MSFVWKELCFLCGELVDDKERDQRKVATFAVGTRVMEMCFVRGYDSWAMEVKGRLESCIDLPAEEAVHHRACYARFLNGRGKVTGEVPRGRPVKDIAQMAFDQLCEHLETMCSSEKLYTLDDLYSLMISWGYNKEAAYCSKTIKNKLQDRYGEHMFFAEVKGRRNVLCFKDMVSHVLSDKWLSERDDNKESKVQKIIQQAARLIAAQLRDMTYDMDYYPDCDQPWLGGENLIPSLLHLFLSQLVRNPLKQAGIAQAIIQAARPRSCIMPIIFALAIEIHQKHGAAELVKVLSRFGFCMSLDEVHRFHQAVMVSNGGWQPQEFKESICTQFIASIVAKIKRLSHRLKAADVCIGRHLDIVQFVGNFGDGLKD
jgi:hypothetical protein